MRDNIFKIKPRQLIIYLLLVMAILAVYGQIIHHDFISLDDELHVINNRRVREGLTVEGIKWALTTNYAGNWQPLTWLSHMLDCQLYGLNPMGHHWTSLQIHMANTLLLFFILQQMTGALWRSALVAALFALHPLHVESVAWVAERKDVLSTFFGMLTIMAYLGYVRQQRLFNYMFVLLFLCLGLMAKPMLVTFPFILILLDFWPLNRFYYHNAVFQPDAGTALKRQRPLQLILEKIPLLIPVAITAVLTLWSQQSYKGVASLATYPLSVRIANALVSYVHYVVKAFWPLNLAVYYPHPGDTLSMWQILGAMLLVAGVSFCTVRISKRYAYMAVGLFWYLGALVPVIGLIQIGTQAMADRYTYIPMIGIYIIIAWGVFDLVAGWRYKRIVLTVAAGAVFSILMMVAWVQVGYWQNSRTLFRHAVDVTKNNWLAHNSLGVALLNEKKNDEAIFHFKKTLSIKPDDVLAYNNIGSALAEQGELDEAVLYFNKALTVKPDYVTALDNLGKALFYAGNYQEAEFYYKKAIRLKPDYASAHYNLGNLLARQGKIKDAVVHYTRAVNINPEFAKSLVLQKN